VKRYLEDGALTAGHARTLVTATDPETLARRIVEEGLTVRAAEAMAQQVSARPARARAAVPPKDADTRALEKQLGDALGLAVEIRHRPDGSGEVRLRYASLEQLDDITRRLV
jgi:ParB family chromosome partitioning protein